MSSATSCRRGVLLRQASRAGAFVVAYWCVIEIRQPQPGLKDHLRDARHLVELDLRHLVGVRVVVGVQAGGEEDDRNSLGRVAVVVAAVIRLLEIVWVVELGGSLPSMTPTTFCVSCVRTI